MDAQAEGLQVYRDLADLYEQRGQVPARDRFLILAADAALAAGLPEEAERLRQRLLQTSRHHMLKPYASFAEAAEAGDVKTYLRDLRLNYPVETALDTLQALRNSDDPPAPPLRAPGQIPPTAPWIDLTGGKQGQPIDRAPIPLARAPAPPAAAPPPPRAQPIPGTQAVPKWRSVAEPEAPPRRPQAAPRPAERASLAPPPDRAAPPEPGETKRERAPLTEGSWLGLALGVLVGALAVACAVLTFARSLVPANWLP